LNNKETTLLKGKKNMNPNKYSMDTLAVRAGYTPDSDQHAAIPPIYQTNSYTFDSAEYAANLFNLSQPGNIYTRLGNPTVAVLEERIAALDGGVAAVAMASGHAIIFNTILNLAQAGDEIVSSICIYGGAINLLGVTLRNLGINVTFVDPDDFEAWEKAITPKTKALFVEVVGNPNANVADISRLAEIAHSHNIPLIADSTLTTPILCRPLEHGADYVIHSATKYLCGHGNSMAGVVVDGGTFSFLGNDRFPQYNNPDKSYHGICFAKDVGPAAFAVRLRTLCLRDTGACLSPFNAFMVLTGMETLHLRMPRHCENAMAVAGFLQESPHVEAVYYPGLPGSRYRELVRKYLPDGSGSVFTFVMKGGRTAGAKLIDSVRLFQHVANLGDNRSLISHPATTTHSQLSDEQLLASGVTPGTVRLSVGIEGAADLIADLEQAIAAAVK